jgi:hypothetical protein
MMVVLAGCESVLSTSNKTMMPSLRELASRWLWLAGWLGMLVVHAKPLVEESLNIFRATPMESQPFSAVRFLVLAVSSVFFLLKIVDVPWLRFRSDFRATVSWLIMISLLHLGVINRAVNEYSGPPDGGLEIVLFVGSAVAAASVGCLLLVAAAARASRRTPVIASFLSHQPWCAIFHNLCWISRTCPRGPPA